jgi:heme oxygenase
MRVVVVVPRLIIRADSDLTMIRPLLTMAPRNEGVPMDHLLNIRRRVADEFATTSIINKLLAGQPDRDAYLRYLVNAYNYAQYSPKIMALAASRCLTSHPELGAYLLRHAEEEQGHEDWALADLADMGIDPAQVLRERPVLACSQLIGFIHYAAAFGNPVGLFGWMYVLEAVGTDMGTPVAERLQAWLGGKASRLVAGHGVADTDHTRDLTEQIEHYIVPEQDRADVVHVAEVVADLYLRMFHQIGGEQNDWR